jgi:hypothetical protein
MSVIATCPCGQKNRLAAGIRQRCGKCGHEFTPLEVMLATIGQRPDYPAEPIPEPPLTQDDGINDDDDPEEDDDDDD